MSFVEKAMRQAIRLSNEKMKEGKGGPFGAVIIKDNKIIAEGWNQVTSSNDPTAHAEVVAIRNACTTLNTFNLEGCTLVTSCEPCPMCLAATYWSRVDKIIYANTRFDAADIGFDDAFFYDELARSIEERQVPMTQMLRDEGLSAFKEWTAKNDRTEY
ncbi:MAG: nucleoside deaminase [Candidatus Paracaedibacteraceae bacterium]|nr:nucleoside deaminase [Candidatus Paracaedibacteraceae bacterium]